MALTAAATAVLMTELGFEPAKSSTINSKLSKLRPNGGTALRDSVGAGIGLILKLNQALSQLGSSEIWNFVHIVITDGQDTSSKTSVENLALTFYMINQTIPTSRCSTSYIGIELTQEAAVELSVISAFGGNSCNAYMANNVNLNNIFDRISVDIGIVRQVGVVGVSNGSQSAMMIRQSNTPVLQVRRNRFAVLLNLDFSGSMAGRRWESLKNSVAMFLRNLQDGDLVSCCLFNDNVQLLNRMQVNDPPKAVSYSQPNTVRNIPPPPPPKVVNYSQSNTVRNVPPPAPKKKKCVVF